MNWIRATLLSVVALTIAAVYATGAPVPLSYVPQAVYCSDVGPQPGGSPLCSKFPGNIGDDPMLNVTIAYNGIGGEPPKNKKGDVQTPFDNLSWQTFIALNWAAGKQNLPAQQGLQGDGPRTWETWSRVSQVFGNAPVTANCAAAPGTALFRIGALKNGQPDGHNEEYVQAATGDPAIDVNGNWTIYERRVNNIEIAYLRAPGGNQSWNLTTTTGQSTFINQPNNTVNFPAAGTNSAANGATEIKAGWRILDPAKHAQNAKRFYIIKATLSVAPSLVAQPAGAKPAPICTQVELGLVAMHIIQKNPLTTNSLRPEWFWSTFEQVDNAPQAGAACNPAKPAECGYLMHQTDKHTDCPPATVPKTADYSFFNPDCDTSACTVNQPPVPPASKVFLWNPEQPFAKSYLVNAKSGGKSVTVGTQVSRCWAIYEPTQQLNAQWRAQLQKIGSVFQNYVLVGTQWGAGLTNAPGQPNDAVPSYLSNSVVETYLQTSYDPSKPFGIFQTGSCVSCHSGATITAKSTTTGKPITISTNFSFLPSEAQYALLRRAPLGAPGHDNTVDPGK